jgi:hypothetical protein
MLRPDDSHDLRLHHAVLDIEPRPSLIHWTHDAFDNSVCFLEWPEGLRTDRLSIVSTLDLTHHPDGPPLPVYTLDPAAEAFPFAYAPEEIPDLASLAKRQEPDPGGMVDAWARRFVGTKGKARTLAVMEAITHAIKAEFRYEVRHEEGTRRAAETIALGSGACRDFAVLMMEALRSFGVATVEAPYVSTGRLPSADVVRALASEAYERFRANRDGRVSDIYPALGKRSARSFRPLRGRRQRRDLCQRRLGLPVLDHERVEAVRVRLGLAGSGP